VGERLDLLVQVRFPDSPPLGLNDWPFKRKPQLEKQSSEPTELEFTINPLTGQTEAARLSVHVVTNDFDIIGASEKILDVRPDMESRKLPFLLSARTPGTCRINVEIYNAKRAYLGLIPIETEIGGQLSPPMTIVANLVLTVVTSPEREPAQRRIVVPDRLACREIDFRAEELPAKADVQDLSEALKNSDREVRRSAAKWLGFIGAKAAVQSLCEALEGDEDRTVRSTAAEALGKIGGEAAVRALCEALKDSDREIRQSAAWALGITKAEAAVQSLCEALEGDEDRTVRSTAAEALGRIGAETAVPALCKALKDKVSEVRWKAAEALGEIGNEAAIPILREVLKSNDLYRRRRATEALGRIGGKDTVPALCEALNDNDLYVRQRAAEALEKIKLE
jgi:HEAT repeat protein